MIGQLEYRQAALRTMAFLPLSYLSIAAVGVVAMLGIVEPNGQGGLFATICVALMSLNVVVYLFSNNADLATKVLLGIFLVFLSGSIYLEVAARFGLYWLILYPVMVVLLLGARIAVGYIALFVISMLPAIGLVDQLGLSYSFNDIASIIIGVLIATCMLYFYEFMIERLTPSDTMMDSIDQRLNSMPRDEMNSVLDDLEEKNKQLEQATAIDEATISSIGEAVLIVDQMGSIIRANPSSGRVLGVNQEDLLGTHIVKSLSFARIDAPDVILNEEQIVIAQSIDHRSIDTEQYKIIRPDGTDLFAQVTASPLVVGGVVYGAVVVVRDVTEEIVVDQAKSEFVSIASHQLRTPLSTINWYLEMVLAGDFGEVNEEQGEFIQEAYDASKRMGNLINALLNASRIDVGVVAVEPEENIDIRDVLRSVLIDLESKLSEKDMTINVDIDESVPKMTLDTRIIEIIFLNLLSNAIKYSPNGQSVSFRATVDDINLVISVKDNGYGIPMKAQEKIFTKMFRADNAIQHEPDGNGLGLYIIKSILDKLNGSISFKSKMGSGATFTVTLPKTGMKKLEGTRALSRKATEDVRISS